MELESSQNFEIIVDLSSDLLNVAISQHRWRQACICLVLSATILDVHMELSIFSIFWNLLGRVLITSYSSSVLSLSYTICRMGYARNMWKVWRRALCQRRIATLHQKIALVDYACASWCCREERSPGSCTVIRRQLRLIWQRYTTDWNDLVRGQFVGRVLVRWHGMMVGRQVVDLRTWW